MNFENFLVKLLLNRDFKIDLNVGVMKHGKNALVKITEKSNTFKIYYDDSVSVILDIEIIDSIKGSIKKDSFIYGAYVKEENLSVVRDFIDSFIANIE